MRPRTHAKLPNGSPDAARLKCGAPCEPCGLAQRKLAVCVADAVVLSLRQSRPPPAPQFAARPLPPLRLVPAAEECHIPLSRNRVFLERVPPRAKAAAEHTGPLLRHSGSNDGGLELVCEEADMEAAPPPAKVPTEEHRPRTLPLLYPEPPHHKNFG